MVIRSGPQMVVSRQTGKGEIIDRQNNAPFGVHFPEKPGAEQIVVRAVRGDSLLKTDFGRITGIAESIRETARDDGSLCARSDGNEQTAGQKKSFQVEASFLSLHLPEARRPCPRPAI